ncbi:hypothetical protein [Actinomyces sp. 565]|uniref:hypothetical protein n=1 Tax=Actinomyces sp. 565 TaxID=2057794 RepID=UPI0013A6B624|nr:hypothetical protein [Actinomyces sp. 565]NDR52858.1 hypothetical protein [Actinomyces sp. 565]
MNTTILQTSPAIRRGAVTLLALGLALPGIVACNDEAPVARAPETEQTQAAPEQSSTPTPSPSADDAEPGVGLRPLQRSTDSPIENADDDSTYWSFPLLYDGWYPETIDEEGRNELDRADGNCLYESGQFLYEDSEYGDTAETVYQADAWVEYLEDEYGDVESTQTTDTTVTDMSGNPVEMIKVQTSYRNNGRDIKAITWMRVFTTIQTPTMMSLHYTCIANAIDETELEDMVSDTHIVNPGPAKMEDGVVGKSSSGSSTGSDDMV